MAPQREWFETDYYKVLGVSETATEKEITRAYRKLAKQYHPDANPGSEDRFKEISAAYDVLGDADKRKEYDEVRRLGPLATSAASAQAPATVRSFNFHVDDLVDLFGGPLRPARRDGAGARGTASTAPRPATSRPSCTCFNEAIEGVVTTVNVVDRGDVLTPAGLGLQARGRCPSSARAAAARACQRQPGPLLARRHRARSASGRGTRSSTPARPATAPGVEQRRAPGEGAHPRRRRGRPADPGEGPGRAGPQRRSGRRPLRHRARRRRTRSSAARAANLTLTRPGHLPRGGARQRHHRALARQAGHPEDPAGHQIGQDLSRARARGSRRGSSGRRPPRDRRGRRAGRR